MIHHGDIHLETCIPPEERRDINGKQEILALRSIQRYIQVAHRFPTGKRPIDVSKYNIRRRHQAGAYALCNPLLVLGAEGYWFEEAWFGKFWHPYFLVPESVPC
jgi:hypothetical protein